MTSTQLSFGLVFACCLFTATAFSTGFISACPARGSICSFMCSSQPDASLPLDVVSDDLFTNGYEPGQTYTITIESSTMAYRGFLMSFFLEDTREERGTFSTTDSKFDASGTNLIGGCTQSIRHANPVGVSDDRTIQWTAPASSSGDLTAEAWMIVSGPGNCVWKVVTVTVPEIVAQQPTASPTAPPTTVPPTDSPTAPPTTVPPTNSPTAPPTTVPPTASPTAPPTTVPPTNSPTAPPTTVPPTNSPTAPPTTVPPTVQPTSPPTTGAPPPTDAPTTVAPPPTDEPTTNAPPVDSPTAPPTTVPPTDSPTAPPTTAPPTDIPTAQPTQPPTTDAPPPTDAPTTVAPPTEEPTEAPVTIITPPPTTNAPPPTAFPTAPPTNIPPTEGPSTMVTVPPPTDAPTVGVDALVIDFACLNIVSGACQCTLTPCDCIPGGDCFCMRPPGRFLACVTLVRGRMIRVGNFPCCV